MLISAGWAVSYWRVIDLSTGASGGGTYVQLFLNRGLILFFAFPEASNAHPASVNTFVYSQPQIFDDNYWRRSRLGFSVVETTVPETSTLTARGFLVKKGTPWLVRREWAVPYWSVAALAATATLLAFIPLHRGRRRNLAGHCMTCGYDLRASADRCPECGRQR